MNKIVVSAILNIIFIILFGWVLATLYGTQMQFADVMKDPEPPWEITVNVLPLLLFFAICTPMSVYFFVKGKRKYKSIWKALMLPSEFKESDEREQLITAKACRSAYIMMWLIAPNAAALLIFYPIIQDIIPYYPIIILLLIPVAQVISYFYTLHKN